MQHWHHVMASLAVISLLILLSDHAIGMVHVERAGVVGPKPGQTALLFYVELVNTGTSCFHNVKVHVEKCCLSVPSQNCIVIPVLDSQMDSLCANSSENITLIYPTMYVFNRVGECSISTSYSEDASPLQYTFTFNTTLKQPTTWVCAAIQAYWHGMSTCVSPDQDPADMCNPVNCVLKYNGQLNYYNASSYRCQKITSCVSDDSSDLPAKAFNRQWNTCKDLGLVMTDDLAARLVDGQVLATDSPHFNLQYLFQHECVHGWERADGSGCDCETGWMSDYMDHRSYNPTTHILKFCNVINPHFHYMGRKHMLLMVTLVMMCVTIALVVVVGLATAFDRCYEHYNRKRASSSLEMQDLISTMERHQEKKLTPDVSLYYQLARVQIPNKALLEGELDLQIGDILRDISKTEQTGMWKGRLGDQEGIFPISCAQFYKDEDQLKKALGYEEN